MKKDQSKKVSTLQKFQKLKLSKSSQQKVKGGIITEEVIEI